MTRFFKGHEKKPGTSRVKPFKCKGAWVDKLLGTLFGVWDHKKVKCSCTVSSAMALGGLKRVRTFKRPRESVLHVESLSYKDLLKHKKQI